MEMDAVTALNLAVALFNVVVICVIVFILVTAKQSRAYRARTRTSAAHNHVNPDNDYRDTEPAGDLCF